jgi:hypothetical protein
MFYGEMDQAQANEHTSTHAFSKTYDNDRNFVSQFTINSHTAHKELQQRIRTGKLHRHRQIRTQISTRALEHTSTRAHALRPLPLP